MDKIREYFRAMIFYDLKSNLTKRQFSDYGFWEKRAIKLNYLSLCSRSKTLLVAVMNLVKIDL